MGSTKWWDQLDLEVTLFLTKRRALLVRFKGSLSRKRPDSSCYLIVEYEGT